jgi:hypothetical protein
MRTRIFLIIVLLGIISKNSLFSQTTTTNNARPATSAFNGWDNTGTPGPLDIRNDFSPRERIDFWLNTLNCLQIQTSGDLDVVQGANGYKIGNNYVLRNNNIPTSIFVGVQSGFSTPTTTGSVNNTYVGYKTGYSTTTTLGYDNTFIGYTAGELTTDGIENWVLMRAMIIYSESQTFLLVLKLVTKIVVQSQIRVVGIQL